jgi:hypothetical protein
VAQWFGSFLHWIRRRLWCESNSTGAQYDVTLQIKTGWRKVKTRSDWLSKMVLAQHFCTVCWGLVKGVAKLNTCQRRV